MQGDNNMRCNNYMLDYIKVIQSTHVCQKMQDHKLAEHVGNFPSLARTIL